MAKQKHRPDANQKQCYCINLLTLTNLIMTLLLLDRSIQGILPDSATAEEVVAFYTPIGDLALPTINHLHTLYRFYGEVLPHKTQRSTSFAVELPGLTKVFRDRAEAWSFWRNNREGLARISGKSL